MRRGGRTKEPSGPKHVSTVGVQPYAPQRQCGITLQPGTAARHNAHADAAKSAVRGAILNFAAAAVNGAVLAAWSTVAWPGREPWTYYVPWLAVACASGLLLATAAYAVWKLNDQRS